MSQSDMTQPPECALPSELPICAHCNTPIYSVFHVRSCPRWVDSIAKIIDPEAFGLPAWRPSDGSDYLTDRDEARDKAKAVLEWMADHG